MVLVAGPARFPCAPREKEMLVLAPSPRCGGRALRLRRGEAGTQMSVSLTPAAEGTYRGSQRNFSKHCAHERGHCGKTLGTERKGKRDEPLLSIFWCRDAALFPEEKDVEAD